MKQQFLAYTMLIAGLLLLIMVSIGIYLNLATFTLLSHIALWVVPALAGLALVYVGLHRLFHDLLDLRDKHLSIAEKQQSLRHADEKHQLELHLATARIAADALGNYPVVNHPHYGFTYLTPGNPAYASPRTKLVESGPQPGLLAAPSLPQIMQPSLDSLAAQLRYNSLEIAYGVTLDQGKIVKASIAESVHFKLIGSSGFGKSCLAAAILHLATMTNDSDHLQLSLLDLENKTSRLFEQLPHVATLKIGRKSIDMIARDADEVAHKLRVLVQELKRRAEQQTETPLMLIYVEEMLSLQYEVDESLLQQMLADLSILALRGRKYGLYLLACSQTDYATDELRAAQKQFRSRVAFSCDPSAARAAGFINTALIKQNYQAGEPGQFVLEKPGFSELMLAPVYDVKEALETSMKPVLSRPKMREISSFTRETPAQLHVVKPTFQGEVSSDTSEKAAFQGPEQDKRDQVQALLKDGFNQGQILLKLWNVKPGATDAYKLAKAEYQAILAQLEQQAEQGVEQA